MTPPLPTSLPYELRIIPTQQPCSCCKHNASTAKGENFDAEKYIPINTPGQANNRKPQRVQSDMNNPLKKQSYHDKVQSEASSATSSQNRLANQSSQTYDDEIGEIHCQLTHMEKTVLKLLGYFQNMNENDILGAE